MPSSVPPSSSFASAAPSGNSDNLSDDIDEWSIQSIGTTIEKDMGAASAADDQCSGDFDFFGDEIQLPPVVGNGSDNNNELLGKKRSSPFGKPSVARKNKRCKPKMRCERLANLKAFKRKYGHCKVSHDGMRPEPSTVAEVRSYQIEFPIHLSSISRKTSSGST